MSSSSRKFQFDLDTLYQILNTIDARVYVKAPDSRFLWANRETLNAHGVKEVYDLIDRNDTDYFRQPHADEARRDEIHIVETREAIKGKHETEVWTQTGKKTHVVTSKYPLFDDESNVVAIVGISKDLTEVRNSMDLLEQILDSLPQCVFYKNKEGRILKCNRSFSEWHKLIGIDDVIGKNDFELWPNDPDLASAFVAGDQRVFKTGEAVGPLIEEHRHFPDGRARQIRTWKFPMYNDCHDVIGLIGIYEDVSRIWDPLTHNVTRSLGHALRTKVGTLQDICAELIDQFGRIEQLAQLERCISRISYVGKMTTGLAALTTAAPPNYTGSEDMSRVVVQDLLAEVVHIVNDPRIQLQQDNKDCVIAAEPFHVQLAVEELLMNALRYIQNVRQGRVWLWSETHDGGCQIHVADNGPGVSPAIRGRLFESPVTTQRGQHTGLGLYYVRAVAGVHGGNVSVRDDRKGAHFVLEFPTAQGACNETGNGEHDSSD